MNWTILGGSSEAMRATPNSTPPKGFKTRSPFYSQRVLTKVLLVMDFIAQEDDPEVAGFHSLSFWSHHGGLLELLV